MESKLKSDDSTPDRVQSVLEILEPELTYQPTAFMANPSYRASELPVLLAPPDPIPGVPVGLELLLPLNYLLVKRKTENTKMLIEIESRHYDIINSKHQRLYFASEKARSTKEKLLCLGTIRPLTISITDFLGRTILELERPFDCRLYCTMLPCFCCIFGRIGGKMIVSLPNGIRLGQIVHKFGCYQPIYEVLDSDDEHVMNVTGSNCTDCCLCNCTNWKKDFHVTLTSNGLEVGCIAKGHTACLEEAFDAVDEEEEHGEEDEPYFVDFGMTMPADLKVRWKALLLAAMFLIHFTYFETPPRHDNLEQQTDRLQNRTPKLKRFRPRDHPNQPPRHL